MRSLVLLAAAGLAATSALARVGGGDSFSGGGGDGGDGDGAIVFALVRFLVWLIFRHPVIGIPVVIVVAIVLVRMAKAGRLQLSARERPRVFGAHGEIDRGPANLTPVRNSDPFFSEPAFLELAQLVYVRAQELRGTGQREPLTPWMSAEAADRLFAERAGLTAVSDVVVGSTRLRSVSTRQGFVEIDVTFLANVTETRNGTTARLLCDERWTFHRKVGVVSPPPSRLRALGCAGCGSTLEPEPHGTCGSCGAPRRGGQGSWEVSRIVSVTRAPLPPPGTTRRGPDEEGLERPTSLDPRLAAARRSFDVGHPDHAWPSFEAHVREVLLRLQAAWSTRTWETARADETDALYQTHRFWMERYEAFGLTNRVESVDVSRIVLSKIDVDAFYESVTVRIFARALDWTEDRDGKVVAGSRTQPVRFSEYWTFLRAIGAEAPAVRACPSCAAPLEASGPASVCPYCGSKLVAASGRWVVSRIEQD